MGAATLTGGQWDSFFGAELAVAHIDEDRPVAALALIAGGGRFGTRDGGRLWLDALAGARGPFGVGLGLSAGIVAEVHEVAPPKLGVHGSLVAFAGVMPYLRVGTVRNAGGFVELGLQIPLPALRWR